jgi:hypothetical protein
VLSTTLVRDYLCLTIWAKLYVAVYYNLRKYGIKNVHVQKTMIQSIIL